MSGLLGHGLFAMVVCGLVLAGLGGTPFSAAIFYAGLISMLIDLDRHELSPTGTTPVGHSVLLGIIWTGTGVAAVLGMSSLGVVGGALARHVAVALPSAYASHLLLDALTREGVFLLPGSAKGLFRSLGDGDAECWSGWRRFPGEGLRRRMRGGEDPMLNLALSLACLGVLIVFLGAAPIP